MEFSSQKPIFLQICDILLDKVLNNELVAGARILSVREFASSVLVNPNTVQRAYTELQTKGIIEQQRGVGYFITKEAKQFTLSLRKTEFRQVQLPQLLHQMQLLGITWQELQQMQLSFEDKNEKIH